MCKAVRKLQRDKKGPTPAFSMSLNEEACAHAVKRNALNVHPNPNKNSFAQGKKFTDSVFEHSLLNYADTTVISKKKGLKRKTRIKKKWQKHLWPPTVEETDCTELAQASTKQTYKKTKQHQ